MLVVNDMCCGQQAILADALISTPGVLFFSFSWLLRRWPNISDDSMTVRNYDWDTEHLPTRFTSNSSEVQFNTTCSTLTFTLVLQCIRWISREEVTINIIIMYNHMTYDSPAWQLHYITQLSDYPSGPSRGGRSCNYEATRSPHSLGHYSVSPPS